MKQSYGTMKRSAHKPTPLPEQLIVKIHGRHTLEQLSLEIQKAIAQLQDHGVFGVEECRFALKPLDDKAQPIALWNDKNEPMARLEIGAPPAPPPYRKEAI